MKSDKIRKIAFILVFVIGFLGFIIALCITEKNNIEYEITLKYYDEKDVNDLAYLIKEVAEHNYTNEEERQLAIHNLLNRRINEFETYYSSYNDPIEKQISDEISDNISGNKYDDIFTQDVFYLDDHMIKKGDYHEYALAIIEAKNDEIHDRHVAEELDEAQTAIEEIIIVLFVILYTYVVFKFVLLKVFNKETIIKDIIKYFLSLIILFMSNIILMVLLIKIINYFGSYKVNAYSFSYVNNILKYGILSPSCLLLVFVISLIIYGLVNIKEIKMCFKKQKKFKIFKI